MTPGPPDTLDAVPGWLPSAIHLLLFLVLAFLLARSLRVTGRPRPLATAFAVALCYGLVLELAQIPIPGRSGEWLDVIWNGVGASAGAAGHLLATPTGSCQNDGSNSNWRG